MKMDTMPVSEEELHAYLDGELPEARCEAVEAHLGEHAEDVARLEAYRRDGEAVVRLFSKASMKARSEPQPVIARGRYFGWRNVAWRNATAAAVIFLVGSSAGWFGRGSAGDSALERLGHQAEIAYFLLDGSTVEVRPSASLSDLSEAVSTALGARITLHETAIAGLSLARVRIVQRPHGQAVQLAYAASQGGVVTLYFEKQAGARDTVFRNLTQNGVTTLVWEEENLGCAITGRMSPEKLEEIARQLYNSLLS